MTLHHSGPICCSRADLIGRLGYAPYALDDTSATAAVVRDGVLQRDLELWIGAASPCLRQLDSFFEASQKTHLI